MPDSKKIDGQIIPLDDGSTLAIVGGSLADLLDLDTWKQSEGVTVLDGDGNLYSIRHTTREQSGPDTLLVRPRRLPAQDDG